MLDGLPLIQPEVWALSNYPEGSGGANALFGVARAFAERTGLELHIHDYRTAAKDFRAAVNLVTEKLPALLRLEPSPESRRPRWFMRDLALKQTASENLYAGYSVPSAILTSFAPYFTRDEHARLEPKTISIPDQVFLANRLDITSWESFVREGYEGIVPHSLSHKNFQEEAARFAPLLKPDSSPLIAIIIAEDFDCHDLTGKLINLAANQPEARFMLSSSPRCSSSYFADVCDSFRSCLNAQQAEKLLTHDFRWGSATANPYKACLTLADHMIVIGRSNSMVSDRLFAGRTVHYGWGYEAESINRHFGRELALTGKIKYFSAESPLVSEQFSSIDATGMIADRLADLYRAHQDLSPRAQPDFVFRAIKNKIRRSLG